MSWFYRRGCNGAAMSGKDKGPPGSEGPIRAATRSAADPSPHRLEGPGSERRLADLRKRFRRVSRREAQGPRSWLWPVLVFLAVVLAGLAGPAARARWQALYAPRPLAGPFEAVDGDTLRAAGEPIRLAGLDAPEMMSSRGPCPAGAALAQRSRDNLARRLAGASAVTFRPNWPRARDRYGRRLGQVFADGVDLGRAQIDAGLARPWVGRRFNWCDG